MFWVLKENTSATSVILQINVFFQFVHNFISVSKKLMFTNICLRKSKQETKKLETQTLVVLLGMKWGFQICLFGRKIYL